MTHPISLDTYSFHLASDVWEPHPGTPRDIFWILERARTLGFSGLHTADMRHFHDRITVDALVEQLDGLTLSLGTGGCDPRHMGEMIDLCARLKHPVFRTFLNRGVTPEKIANLREVMPAAEKAGVVIAIENHQDLTSREILEVLKAVGSTHLGACLDFGNALGVFEEPLAVCEALAPHVFTTHVKEYAVYPARMAYVFWSVPEGSGSCRVREQLEILFDRSPLGRDLPLNLEAPIEFIDQSDANAVQIVDKVGRLAAGPPPPFRTWTPEEALRNEELLVRESLEGLRGILGEIGI